MDAFFFETLDDDMKRDSTCLLISLCASPGLQENFPKSKQKVKK